MDFGINFLIVCVGALATYAAFISTKKGWLRIIIVFAAVVGLAQLAVMLWFDTKPPHQTTLSDPVGGFVGEQYAALKDDACLLHYIKQTPLSSLAYMAQLDNFLHRYKTLQLTALRYGQVNGPGLPQISRLMQQSFTETAADLSPPEIAAVDDRQTNAHSLCLAFGKWVGKIQSYSPDDQKQIWQSFLGDAKAQDHED